MKARENEARKRSSLKEYQKYKRIRLGAWDPDWRVVLSDLFTHTPKHEEWHDRALEVVVPDIPGKYVYGVGIHMMDIGERYGCAVTPSNRDTTTEGYRSFFLSGSTNAISRTSADILQISPDTILRPMPEREIKDGHKQGYIQDGTKQGVQQGGDKFLVRSVEAGHVRKLRPMRADKVRIPIIWNQRSFADYVSNLTSMEMPNHLRRMLYKYNESHTSTVAGILRDIFEDPACKSSLSREAFNTAIEYFVKKSLIKDARVLFVHMEIAKVQPDVETFNIMLRGTAKSEDIHNFHYILHLMLKRGISPNAKTWIAYMMMIHDFRFKLFILSSMRERGLLRQISTIKAVCEHMVPYEISTSLEKGQTQQEFLDNMDSRYGTYWLTSSSANKVLHDLGAHGLVSRSWEFLQVMISRSIMPDKLCISTILRHCRNSANVGGAIDIMKDLPPAVKIGHDEEFYDILFMLAWRTRCYNIARVVWAYACLNALSTWKMRSLVMSSLQTADTGTEGTHSSQRWKQQAGIFISGNSNWGLPPTSLPGDSAGRDTAAGYSGAPAKAIDTAQKERAVITGHVKDQMTAFQHWTPARPLPEMLVEAWERDQEWKSLESSTVSHESWSLAWKLKRAIAIPTLSRPPALNMHPGHWS